jgi:hypothetical protein
LLDWCLNGGNGTCAEAHRKGVAFQSSSASVGRWHLCRQSNGTVLGVKAILAKDPASTANAHVCLLRHAAEPSCAHGQIAVRLGDLLVFDSLSMTNILDDYFQPMPF